MPRIADTHFAFRLGELPSEPSKETASHSCPLAVELCAALPAAVLSPAEVEIA
jgi:hypothetical protein